METGAMDRTLLQAHGIGMAAADRIAAGTAGVRSGSMAAACLNWRSGDDVADGGHMIPPSIGQAIPPIASASLTDAAAGDRSGIAHIVPRTWQKTKLRIRATNDMLSR